MSSNTRSIDVSIDIEATPEQVWDAITNPNEIPRWLAPMAAVQPGVGGFIELSWGPGMTGRNTIRTWDQPDRLVLTNDDGLTESYSISSRAAHSRLHLIHSGFSPASAADDQFDAITNGWNTFLRMCRYGLIHHAGKPYRNITLFSPLNLKRDLAWNEIIKPGSLTKEGLPELKEGQHFELTLVTGQYLTGSVVHAVSPGYLVLSADNLDHSLFALFSERGGEGSLLTITWILSGDALRLEDRLRAQWNDWISSTAQWRADDLSVFAGKH